MTLKVNNSNHKIPTPWLETNSAGRIPIQEACRLGNLAEVKAFLIANEKLPFLSEDQLSSLTHQAVRDGNKKLVELLITHNPESLYYRDRNGNTPAHLAAKLGNIVLFNLLASRNPLCVQYLDFNGNTPLHVAAQQGSLAIVQSAIRIAKEHQISVRNVKNNKLQTPLMLATLHNHQNIAKCLIDIFKARTSLRDHNKRSVFHIAAMNGQWDLFGTLLEKNHKGARHMDRLGIAPLNYAAAEGNQRAIRLLLNSGATVNHRLFNGATALHQAARNNKVSAIRLLFNKGAELDIQEIYSKMTPLHEAVLKGNVEAVRCLKKLGADLNIRDKNENRPIDCAREKNNKEIIRILES